MASSNSTALLIDAPAGRHFAQLHKDPQVLADAVGIFVETGLMRGQAVLIIAPPYQVPSYLKCLQYSDKPMKMWKKTGQLTVLDGPSLMGRFMKDEMPVWEDFRKMIAPVLEERMSGQWKGMRVYGELVNDLWRAGHTAAAIRLEEYWKLPLNKTQPKFYIFCLNNRLEVMG